MIAGELVSTGIVEIERDGCVHRGQYRTDGATLTVAYGAIQRKSQLKGPATVHATARALLREIVAAMRAQSRPA